MSAGSALLGILQWSRAFLPGCGAGWVCLAAWAGISPEEDLIWIIQQLVGKTILPGSVIDLTLKQRWRSGGGCEEIHMDATVKYTVIGGAKEKERSRHWWETVMKSLQEFAWIHHPRFNNTALHNASLQSAPKLITRLLSSSITSFNALLLCGLTSVFTQSSQSLLAQPSLRHHRHHPCHSGVCGCARQHSVASLSKALSLTLATTTFFKASAGLFLGLAVIQSENTTKHNKNKNN